MLFRTIVSEGIAHNSYIVGSGGVAAVIDPRRDYEVFLDIADQSETVITHIFETHRNEDYFVGSRDLAARCGAGIYHGRQLPFAYGVPVKEGDRFRFGSLEIAVLETPGHTEESISLVLRDLAVSPDPYMIFSGDTIFSGDIARTDFFGKDRNAEMAAKIFDSINNKILALGDGVIICPAHGAGSVCGGEITDHLFTTVGYERRTNRQIKMGREAFIRQRVTESPYVPPYFRHMEKYNLGEGHATGDVSHSRPLGISQVHDLMKSGAQIVDIRSPTSFSGGYIRDSLSIWREGIPAFAGWFLSYEKPIILVDDFNVGLDMVFRHFGRLGYDNITGYLAGGFPAWSRGAQEIAVIDTCSVQQLKGRLEKETPYILDVRDIKNYNSVGHIRGAHHIYVGELPQRLAEIPKNEHVVICCDAGYKGSLAASILARNRYHDISNVLGGMQAWVRAGFPVEKSP
ncbi:MAG: MBL fold metallo-hydrolase [Methanoregula sp.]|nr:MAG: MBL fold metallo-hydrolase [Methanoregula sp.]